MNWGDAVRKRLDAAIASAEERTDAELLVVIAPSSGPYRDVDHLAAAIVSAGACFALLSVDLGVYELPDEWIVAPVVAVYVLVVALSSRLFLLRRLFTTQARRAAQVKRAAQAAFVDEKVHATKTRNGVLFYFSDLENRVEIVADHGVKGRVDDATWSAVAFQLDAAARVDALAPAVEKALAGVTDLLAKRIPRTAGRGADEIARRIRVRS